MGATPCCVFVGDDGANRLVFLCIFASLPTLHLGRICIAAMLREDKPFRPRRGEDVQVGDEASRGSVSKDPIDPIQQIDASSLLKVPKAYASTLTQAFVLVGLKMAVGQK